MRQRILIVANVAVALALLGATCVSAGPTTRIYYFTAANCPHCQEYGPRLYALLEGLPAIELVEHDVWVNRTSMQLLIDLLATHGSLPAGTPAVFLGDRVWVGGAERNLVEIEAELARCRAAGCPDAMVRLAGPGNPSQKPRPSALREPSVSLPLLGEIDPRTASLPLVTIALGLLDSVNPCAFFILLFLLSLMGHAHSRGRMLTVGTVFVACSGLIYFLFMAAWLNLFLATGGITLVTALAGVTAMVIGAFNIKDYFFLHRGPSLSIPEKVKPTLYHRVRNLVQSAGYPSLLGGTILLAIAANSYELLCTAGLPMVYTRILTLHGLPVWQYYVYLGFYNLVYVIPLLAIVVLFAVTLGTHRLSEREGRFLKLISGVMMAWMGAALLLEPTWLNSLSGTVMLLITALLTSGVIVVCQRWWQRRFP